MGTVAWMAHHKELLGSDGRLVLCGYSSGGHCASLHALSKDAPKYEAVVLISGLFSLRTDTWTGGKLLLKPVFNLLFGDAYGATDDALRKAASPTCAVPRQLKGDWYVLTAKMELMRAPVIEDILFGSTDAFCDALQAAGAKVHRVTCGLNHWLLIFGIDAFVGPFSRS